MVLITQVYGLLKRRHIFNMSKAIIKVVVYPVLISYHIHLIARIFTVTDDRRDLIYMFSRLSLE